MMTLLAAASCNERLTEEEPSVSVPDAVMTKVINTPSDSEDGAVLVCLTEDAADAWTTGDRSLVSTFSENVQVKALKPVYTIAPGKEEIARDHNLHRWFKVEFEDADKSLVAARLSAYSSVVKVQFNKTVVPASDLTFTPYTPSRRESASADLPFNDPMLGDQWHYINTGKNSGANSAVEGGDVAVKDAWKLTGGDRRIIVAVIDGPVKYDHPDIAPNMWKNEKEISGNGIDDDKNGYPDDIYGWNCEAANGNINWAGNRASGHGTHVAGTVAAVNGNGVGVCGIAGGTGNGDGVRIMSCQIFENGMSTNLDASGVAFVYAADNGASIAQCSFGLIGGGYQSDKEYSELYGAEYAGVSYFLDKRNNNSDILDGNIIIAAAGNERTAYSSYPAALEDVISVTAVGPDYLPAVDYTNYGPGCNIAAPGGDFYVGNITSINDNRSRVLSTFINTVKDENLGTSGHDYVYMQGTSMACPHVSGVAALGLSYAYKVGKKLTREQFTSFLLTSVNAIEDLNKNFQDGFSKFYYENGKQVNVDMGPYRGMMGTGVVDAWKLLMNIEGIPTLTVRVLGAEEKAKRYDLQDYFGGSSADLEYVGIECDAATKEALGLTENPEIKFGKLSIKPTKAGSGKVTIKALAGFDEDGEADGENQIGGMEISRTISILARGVASDNGGWL